VTAGLDDDTTPAVADPSALPLFADDASSTLEPPLGARANTGNRNGSGHLTGRTGNGRPAPLRPRSVDVRADDAASPGAPHTAGTVVDWSLVAALRAQASEQLSHAVAADRGRLDRAAQEELGRSIVLDLIEAAVAEDVNAGRPAWSAGRQVATARAVFDSLFRLGRLQPLVDDDRVENIIIAGHDNVLLEQTDGSLVAGTPVADSDEELIDFLVFLASRSEVNARGFSEAQPRLHLRLDGGARLAAAAWVTPRPSVVIRRHRLMEVTLDDLVERGTLTPVAASFLRAAVRARRSIVVSGAQGAGKTTLVRALCAEIDPWEALGTFETEYELHLHELTDRHRIVHAWEARPGSGERGPDGRQAGEFTLDEALVDSFRFNLSRQIVGEVRGKEIWAMIKAMESGTGSISTTHASDAVAAVRKLVTCAMEAGPHITHTLATSKLAATIDLIVHLELTTTCSSGTRSNGAHGGAVVGGARRQRRVAEVIALAPGEHETGYATTHVFAPGPDGTAMPGVLPDEYRALAGHGFDLAGYLSTQAGAP
jgi:Flp pilus assembly CpaF family ATPase